MGPWKLRTMQILFPFNSVCLSAVFLRPAEVISLQPMVPLDESRVKWGISARLGKEDWRARKRTIRSRPPAPCLRLYRLRISSNDSIHFLKNEYDVLTKSSNPSKVPVNSRSFFMMTHILEPMHRSMSSALLYCRQIEL